jgi:hypothetical protein
MEVVMVVACVLVSEKIFQQPVEQRFPMLQLRAPNLYLGMTSRVVLQGEIASDLPVVVLLLGRFCELVVVTVLQGVVVRVLGFRHDRLGHWCAGYMMSSTF